MVRLALIGYGAWGRNYVDAAHQAGNAVVTHVVLRQGSTNALPSARQHLTISHDLDLVMTDVDAVVYAGHPSGSAEWCCRALAAGLPVMAEKPVGLSLHDADRVARAVARSAVPFLVAHQHLFARAYEELRRACRRDPPRIVSSAGYGHGPFRDYSPLWDYGPHDIAMALDLLGLDPGTDAVAVRCWRRGQVFDLSIASDERQAIISVSNARAKRRAIVAVSDHVHVYDDLAAPDRRYSVDGQGVAVPYEPPLTRAVRSFADAVRCRGTLDPRFGARWGVRVARVLEAAQQCLDDDDTEV